MIVVFVACLVGLVVVLVALDQDEPLPTPGPARPAFTTLPSPGDIVRTDFPLAWPGYDPATVDVHLEALAKAWAELLAAAPPEVVERAQYLAAMRNGSPVASPRDEPSSPEPGERLRSTLVGTDPDNPEEALRTHAALELLAAGRHTP